MLLTAAEFGFVAGASCGPGCIHDGSIVLKGREVLDGLAASVIEVPQANGVAVGGEGTGWGETLLAGLGVTSVVGNSDGSYFATERGVALGSLPSFRAKDEGKLVLAVVSDAEVVGSGLVVDDLAVFVEPEAVVGLVEHQSNMGPLCGQTVAKQDLLTDAAVPPHHRTLGSCLGWVDLYLDVEAVVGVGSVVVEQEGDLTGAQLVELEPHLNREACASAYVISCVVRNLNPVVITGETESPTVLLVDLAVAIVVFLVGAHFLSRFDFTHTGS